MKKNPRKIPNVCRKQFRSQTVQCIKAHCRNSSEDAGQCQIASAATYKPNEKRCKSRPDHAKNYI